MSDKYAKRRLQSSSITTVVSISLVLFMLGLLGMVVLSAKQISDHVKVISHDSSEIHSTPVPSSSNILLLSSGVDVVGVDEAQFFDMELVNVCNQLADDGIRVIVAGLDMDYLGNPFGPIPHLLATAEYVTKVHAICIRCGNLANHSHRISGQKDLVVLGETNAYEALCRDCFKLTKEG